MQRREPGSAAGCPTAWKTPQVPARGLPAPVEGRKHTRGGRRGATPGSAGPGVAGQRLGNGKKDPLEGRLRSWPLHPTPTYRWLPAASPGAHAEVPLQAEEAAAASGGVRADAGHLPFLPR